MSQTESSVKDLYGGWACNPLFPKQIVLLLRSTYEVGKMLQKLGEGGGWDALAMDKQGDPGLYSSIW